MSTPVLKFPAREKSPRMSRTAARWNIHKFTVIISIARHTGYWVLTRELERPQEPVGNRILRPTRVFMWPGRIGR